MNLKELQENYLNGNYREVKEELNKDDLKEFIIYMIDYIYKNSDYINEELSLLIKRIL